jgi:UDP-glucose 4-epimerase
MRHMSRILVTGGSGFIGSHLVERLAREGHDVTVFDNFSSGHESHIAAAAAAGVRTLRGDVRDGDALLAALADQQTVFHLAAFTDTTASNTDRSADFVNGTMAMHTLLEAMVTAHVGDLVFPSSQLVFGGARPTPYAEDCGPLLPITLYGASKLACEGLASVYAASFDFRVTVLRLSNIVGPQLRGGIIVDLLRKLMSNPDRLELLGDGRQTRSYLDVNDCTAAMLHCHRLARPGHVNLFHVANRDAISASEVARIVAEEACPGRKVELAHAGGLRGWSGDVPTVVLDTSRLESTGWRSSCGSAEAVRRATRARLAVMSR